MPFRGAIEGESLQRLCSRLPRHLERHGIEFALLLVRQVDTHPFNRGALVNTGLSAVMQHMVHGSKFRPDWHTYLALQDIDRFPTQENRSCEPFSSTYYSDPGPMPRVLHPTSYTGGVLLLQSTLFRAVNGFSNRFWGWGHEDNELYLRLRRCGLQPMHARHIQWCMEHDDCSECKRAKTSDTVESYRAETQAIALVQHRLHYPGLIVKHDGFSTVQFAVANSTRRMVCGRHSLRVLDVHLHRATTTADECVADGGVRDNGCVAGLARERVPAGVIDCVVRSLPHSSHAVEILAATRTRVLYNFRYEVDVRAIRNSSAPEQGGVSVFRVSVCAQEWQGIDVPDSARYQPMWRAIQTRRPKATTTSSFRMAKDFHYKGHFPCSLTPPPWSNSPSRQKQKHVDDS
jgi:xylosylprotein 4-beta-galactosyltransferase